MNRAAERRQLKISLISLHGLIRGHTLELGRDADTGGQVLYVIELARELAKQPGVQQVELLTRQIIDPRVDDDYAQLEEPLADNAKIIRIPFGPKRYLRKESLWPYIELFIDQTLAHFRRSGVPDVIHGHYADAGLAGAQLARLMRIPYVFTGHSLGRVKKQRLLAKRKKADGLDNLEKRYRFNQRIEAEEIALETAAIVVTSTNQEVHQQYELYDHYVPARMDVFAPGVNLRRFTPPDADWNPAPMTETLSRFLNDPTKPLITTIARPDERKNISMLVRVYGESEQLQQLANLVLLLGSRDDFRELPKGQRSVIEEILYLVDRYDLYGSVAYPKTHAPDDVPELYRLTAHLKGVFINPALTEPFGLTLLEAGATGVPLIATNDGGPGDIIANCRNGLLVDPLDPEAIERALVRSLTEPEQWAQWSANGIAGTREHYSWTSHARRYLRSISELVDQSRRAPLSRPARRRLPEFDRIIITDLDNTLTGDDEALAEFCALIRDNDHIGFGIATGRTLDGALELIEELDLPRPDLLDTDVGTQLHYGEQLLSDRSWRNTIGYAWRPAAVREVLAELPGLTMQPQENQSEFKISYELDSREYRSTAKIKRALRSADLRAQVILSLGMYLDIIPVRGGSGLSLRHLLWKWAFAPEDVLVSGDSGNDAGMLVGGTLGVVVGNYSAELKSLRNRPRIYFAQASHAAGLLEGIRYYNFLGDIVIPNDRID